MNNIRFPQGPGFDDYDDDEFAREWAAGRDSLQARTYGADTEGGAESDDAPGTNAPDWSDESGAGGGLHAADDVTVAVRPDASLAWADEGNVPSAGAVAGTGQGEPDEPPIAPAEPGSAEHESATPKSPASPESPKSPASTESPKSPASPESPASPATATSPTSPSTHGLTGAAAAAFAAASARLGWHRRDEVQSEDREQPHTAAADEAADEAAGLQVEQAEFDSRIDAGLTEPDAPGAPATGAEEIEPPTGSHPGYQETEADSDAWATSTESTTGAREQSIDHLVLATDEDPEPPTGSDAAPAAQPGGSDAPSSDAGTDDAPPTAGETTWFERAVQRIDSIFEEPNGN